MGHHETLWLWQNILEFQFYLSYTCARTMNLIKRHLEYAIELEFNCEKNNEDATRCFYCFLDHAKS